jgi:exosome complex RNA-binding protein Csl4
MYKRQGRIIEQKEVQADIEATVGGQDDLKIDGGAIVSQSNGVVSRDGSEIELTEHPGP